MLVANSHRTHSSRLTANPTFNSLISIKYAANNDPAQAPPADVAPTQEPATAAPVTQEAAPPVIQEIASAATEEEEYSFALPIDVNYYRQLDLGAMKTFRIVNLECNTSGQNSPLVHAAETELRNQLVEHNLTPSEHADAVFYLLITRDDRANVEACNKAIGYHGYHCAHCDINRIPAGYQGGTLIIQMVDSRSQWAVWRGIGTANLNNISHAEELVLVGTISKRCSLLCRGLMWPRPLPKPPPHRHALLSGFRIQRC